MYKTMPVAVVVFPKILYLIDDLNTRSIKKKRKENLYGEFPIHTRNKEVISPRDRTATKYSPATRTLLELNPEKGV